jgi:hypothetical protein
MFKTLGSQFAQLALLVTMAVSLTGCFVYPDGDDGYRHDRSGHHDRDDYGSRHDRHDRY